jgi:acetylornithine aminotransferase
MIRSGLRTAFAGVAGVIEVRGMGLMIGIEVDRPCGELVKQALESGLLINVTAERVIRLLPPLVIDEAAARELVSTLAALIRQFIGKGA